MVLCLGEHTDSQRQSSLSRPMSFYNFPLPLPKFQSHPPHPFRGYIFTRPGSFRRDSTVILTLPILVPIFESA